MIKAGNIFNHLFAIAFLIWAVLLYADAKGDELQKAYHCLTAFENGYVNWSTGKIRAVGKAFPDEKSAGTHEWIKGAARADANRSIIEILKTIKLTRFQKVAQYAANNDVILAGIEKTARDARILKQYYTSALAVEMTIETSMFGGFLQLVLPEDIRQIPEIKVETEIKNRPDMDQIPYSGLILDARGLNFEPVLNPVIVSEHGHDVYSSAFISREFAVQAGVIKYLCSMKQAEKDSRVGSHPLLLKGLRKEGKENTSIVISMADYRKLEAITERHRFLKECRVIIVKDL